MTALKELQKYTFVSKYARWLPDQKRRETWQEAVDRVKNMMLEKYKDKNVDDEINWAYDFMLEKKVLGSQRLLQFGGKPVLKKNVRSYNCSGSYVNRLDFFQECMYVLLCGAGVGYSVQFQHINQLPKFNQDAVYGVKNKYGWKSAEQFIIPDTIEGWSDSIGKLVSSYLSPAGQYVEFNYSKIRPEGAYLSSSSGRAPGPEPLKRAHNKIRALLDRCIKDGQERLKPIDAHDLICYISDAVLSGGVRRSSCIALFSLDDKEMMKCKTGNWLQENPQRARANNSVILLRKEIDKKTFKQIFENIREYGEPGFIFADDKEALINPCQPGWAYILTPEGLQQIDNINIGDLIWTGKNWTTVTNKTHKGIQSIYKYNTTASVFYGTAHHKVLTNKEKIEVDQAESIDIITGPNNDSLFLNQQYVMDGLVLGDGSVHKASNNLVYLCIGQKDKDYFTDEVSKYIIKHRPGISTHAYTIQTNILYSELPLTYERSIPKRYIEGNAEEVASFLRGLFSANGSICGNRITLKSASKNIIENVQLMLSSIGIKSYFTTNKGCMVKFQNGCYPCKKSYDLNISTDRKIFAKYIGFIQKYKQDKLNKILNIKSCRSKTTYDIISKEFIGMDDVYDLTTADVSHSYWTHGCHVANCGEIALYAHDDETSTSGWSFCNLSTINCGNLENEEDFYERCKAATIIGTLQAGLTDFSYLKNPTQKIVEKEALLGVSMTGMMEKSEITLNSSIQKKAAKLIQKTNRDFATKIGINSAARCTAIKPSGTASLLCSTSSGIHPHHAKRYLRRVQNNITEIPYQHFKRNNPWAVETSIWSSNSTDENIIFPIEVPAGSKTKYNFSALSMLECVKNTQQNWINSGKNIDLCLKPWLNHSVSNTIFVQDDEWDEIIDFIYKNRRHFVGLSFISEKGDLDYPQAPYTTVLMSHEIVSKYGNYAIWTSGLIERALRAFDNNLWQACDFCLIDTQREEAEKLTLKDRRKARKSVLQLEFYDDMVKFAKKFVDNDIRQLTYCMKDVYNWKLYCELQSNLKPVDYTKMVEETDNTHFENEPTCSGGACLI